MADPRSIYFPLASNAKALLAGAPVETVRSRIKIGSLLYDAVLLQSGSMQIQAGPNGGSSFIDPNPDTEQTRSWQTTSQRHAAVGARHVVLVGSGEHTSPTSDAMHAVVDSETTVMWQPTLQPFARELPAAATWVDFVSTKLDREANRAKDAWISRDKLNNVLKSSVPVDFVRSRVIASANTDFACAAFGGASVSGDPLHMEVMRARLDERADWGMRGYALPVLVPDTGRLSWDAIVDLRKDKHISRLRSAIYELEARTIEEVKQGADIEEALHRVYAHKLREDLAAGERLSAAVGRTLAAFVVGVGATVASLGIVGPAALAVGGGAAALVSGGEMTQLRRSRRRGAWIQALERIEVLAAEDAG